MTNSIECNHLNIINLSSIKSMTPYVHLTHWPLIKCYQEGDSLIKFIIQLLIPSIAVRSLKW